ncbi:ATP-binding protein [Pseudomonas japonica]|uniref:AAA+ ATPase domain-containing protein n=1 Tax=Pseudomonas japonica TaxID=256466 RepID=A0A239I439_9PSED|nr:ATP-binding protein [Pseudomonas japonica]SNS88058.1 hypothetical protein SAMN05444352_11792 [Pseudomonas japonica]
MEIGSSPASRGAAGAYIEGELGALYLLALITGNRARGLPQARVVSVQFQGVENGFALDDLIIFGAGHDGDYILEIQSKRDITFSPADKVFKDVATQLAQSKVRSVPEDRHFLGIATQRTSRNISGAYQDVLKWARSAEHAEAFFTRLAAKGVASSSMREFIATTQKHLVSGGVVDDPETIWRILRRLLILEFDFEATSPMARTHGISLARTALADGEEGRAEALWSRLIEFSIKTGTTGGTIDLQALRANLAEAGFQLAGHREYGQARAKLAELAHNTLAHIGMNVAGVTLLRLEAISAIDDAFENHRFVVVRGNPGVGKSSILRHFAERAARLATIIVLDPDSTPSGGWLAFSNALGIPGVASDFLNDLAASGGTVIFIDGLDMFEDTGRQRTVLEILRAASAIPDFKVITTMRNANDICDVIWLDEQIVTALGGTQRVEIGALSDAEVATLIEQAPALQSVLSSSHPAAGLSRNLYRLSRLLKVSSPTRVHTEAGMARLWWSTADNAPTKDIRGAQRLVAALAESVLKGGRGLEVGEDSAARSHLVETLTLKEIRRDCLDFYHDVLCDWGIGSYLAENFQHLASLDLSVPVSPRIARGIEFSARLVLESGADAGQWLQLLQALAVSGAHSSWRRQAILALPRSEIGYQLLDKCRDHLLANEAALLVELCTTVSVVETISVADLKTLEGAPVDKPRSFRISITWSATLVLCWLLKHKAAIPLQAIPTIVELVKIQLFSLKENPSLGRETAIMLFGWLRQLDLRDAEVTIPGARSQAIDQNSMVERLRLIAVMLGSYAPDELKLYLKEVANEESGYKTNAIRELSNAIAPVAPRELADLVLKSLVPAEADYGLGGRIRERALTYADSSYLPASPAQPPFLDLLESAPDEGLRLIRTLVSHAITFSTDDNDTMDSGFAIDLGDGPRLFPRPDSYLWSRDQCNEGAVASGLKALEAWSQQRLDGGMAAENVLTDILGPQGSCAAYVLVAVDVLLSHADVAHDALARFIASPELLAADSVRCNHDRRGSVLDQFALQGEPYAKVKLADLEGRPSRRVALFDMVPWYLADDEVANRLRAQLSAAIAGLEPIGAYSSRGDKEVIARIASNMLQRSNWIDIEGGKLAYQSPPEEAANLQAMAERQIVSWGPREMELRIDLAFDGNVDHANASTAREAVAYASGGFPDDSDTDYQKTRSTRLIMTALLAARDGDDELLASAAGWIRQVINITLEERSDRHATSTETLRFNRQAIAILALIHLWTRTGDESDRNDLIRLSVRNDRCAAPAFSIGRERILEHEPKLFKAAMRAAFASMVWRWSDQSKEGESEQVRFCADQAKNSNMAVAAEIAWLDGGPEPAWPAWPEEQPILQQRMRIRIPSLSNAASSKENDAAKPNAANSSSDIRLDSRSAAQWLKVVQEAPREAISWRSEVVLAYAAWTSRMNGLGLPADVEISSDPNEWNSSYYALFAERLLDRTNASWENDLKLVTDLPGKQFGKIAQVVILSADALYFNDRSHPPGRPTELRARLTSQVMSLQSWQNSDNPSAPRVKSDLAGIVARMFLNTYNPFGNTYCYLPPSLSDRVDPLLSPIAPLLPGGPTAFVALCTLNLLEVRSHTSHLGFLLEAAESWFGRTDSSDLWVNLGIGRRVVQWFEQAALQEPDLLGPVHPCRARIDSMVGRLVSVGVAEAHEFEKKIADAAEAHREKRYPS